MNQIDEIFYENRGRRQTIEVDGEPLELGEGCRDRLVVQRTDHRAISTDALLDLHDVAPPYQGFQKGSFQP